MERDRLIEENIRLAYWVAEKFRRCGMEYDDIVGCCMLGLVKAAGMYDPGRGKFSTFSVRVMRYEMSVELRNARRKKRQAATWRAWKQSRRTGCSLPSWYPTRTMATVKWEAAMLYDAWMEKLTGREKGAARLLVGEGLSQEDAARRMGLHSHMSAGL